MRAPPKLRISCNQKGLTLREVVVLLFVVAALLFVVIRGLKTTASKALQTKSFNKAKEIGFACKAFGSDHEGQYPSYVFVNGTTTKTRISDYSNTAFDQLLPTYLQTIQPFHLATSAWTPTVMVDPTDATMQAGKSLPAGSNEWAYVAGLRDTSDPRFPLIADGFADLHRHDYRTIETTRGGVWRGRSAIVVFADDSAQVIECDPWTHRVPGSPNGRDLFDTSGQAGWMSSTGTNGQTVLNPE